ncbi:hypothetical protein [Deinococcus yunweiensis]|uniref:hypothetical protein n=1 Tax=Deinococcus yunweiensis TaxID=367282 RepID=UPI00398ED7A7
MSRNQIAYAVLKHLSITGTRTVRAVTRLYGPRPNWQILVTREAVREVATCYGPVLTFGDVAHQHYGHQHWIRSPSALADHAYLQDAIERLQGEGYELVEYEYKRGPTGQPTAQVIRARMRAPTQILNGIVQDWGASITYRPPASSALAPREVGGHPWLYARISGGGINLPMVRRLHKTHTHDIDTWRTPLLIATPDERPMRSYLRSLEAATTAAWERPPAVPVIARYHRLRVIEQPRPDLIRRAGARRRD